jgi:2-phospho-L-lactate/phosphoenolpyruvate guanylyltransferase
MTVPVSIVIPIKGLRTGKSRLAHLMPDDTRSAINRHLAERTLRIAASIYRPADICAVSPDADVGVLAAGLSANFLLQTTRGLNRGLAEAARQLPQCRTVYIAADLPDLSGDDIRALIDVTGIGIAPDQSEQGTNALSLPTPTAIDFRFGPNSFELHRADATKSGFAIETINRPGLAFDLDTEVDFARLKGWPAEINPRNLLT